MINVTHWPRCSFVECWVGRWVKPDPFFQRYSIGQEKPRYPLPCTIGYVPGKYGTYQIHTNHRYDGMPLFRGYTWFKWWNTPIKHLKSDGVYSDLSDWNKGKY